MKIDPIPTNINTLGLPAEGAVVYVGVENLNPEVEANRLIVKNGRGGDPISNPFYVNSDGFYRTSTFTGEQVNPWVDEDSYSIKWRTQAGGLIKHIPSVVSDAAGSGNSGIPNKTVNDFASALVTDFFNADLIFIRSEISGWEGTGAGPDQGFYAYRTGSSGPPGTGTIDLFYDAAGTEYKFTPKMFTYKNATSGLGATNYQDAIDENNVEIKNNSALISSLEDKLDVKTPKGFLNGYIISAYSGIQINIGAGSCRSSDNTATMTSSGLTKTMASNWSEGGIGGKPSAITLTDNTGYFVFVIGKVDGSVDFGFDDNINATNLLADAIGYTLYRRIGWVWNTTNLFASGIWVDDRFTFDSLITIYDAIETTTAAIHLLPIPAGIKYIAGITSVSTTLTVPVPNNIGVLYTDPDNSDITPTTFISQLIIRGVSGTPSLYTSSFEVSTNTSSEVRSRASASTPATVNASLRYVIDTRGKNA